MRLRLLSPLKEGIKVRVFLCYVEVFTKREEGRGSKLHICYVPFERHYAWMDETSVYCITTIIFSAPLETSFCSLSLFFTLEERVIPALCWSGAQIEGMKWTKLTINWGNLWRAGPLHSFLLLASGQQCMSITYFCVLFQQITIALWGHTAIAACIHLKWPLHLRGYTAWL